MEQRSPLEGHGSIVAVRWLSVVNDVLSEDVVLRGEVEGWGVSEPLLSVTLRGHVETGIALAHRIEAIITLDMGNTAYCECVDSAHDTGESIVPPRDTHTVYNPIPGGILNTTSPITTVQRHREEFEGGGLYEGSIVDSYR